MDVLELWALGSALLAAGFALAYFAKRLAKRLAGHGLAPGSSGLDAKLWERILGVLGVLIAVVGVLVGLRIIAL